MRGIVRTDAELKPASVRKMPGRISGCEAAGNASREVGIVRTDAELKPASVRKMPGRISGCEAAGNASREVGIVRTDAELKWEDKRWSGIWWRNCYQRY